MKFLEWFRRFRTSKGFGVHSPFAFWLLTDVIRGQYAYYGYEEIEEALEQHPKGCYLESILREHSRLILRLAGRIRQHRAVLPGNCPAAVRAAVRGAGKKTKIFPPCSKLFDGPRTMVWSEAVLPRDIYLQNALYKDGSLVVVFQPDPGVKEELLEMMTCGVLVDCISALILVVKKDLRKACYDIFL